MIFEWDEQTREKVLRDRGIDFVQMAYALFDGRPIVTVPSPRDGEVRFMTIGFSEGRLFGVAWTWRDGAIRVITARRARDAEERRYRAVFG